MRHTRYAMNDMAFPGIVKVLAERSMTVSYEAVRLWCLKFGQTFTKKFRRRRGQPSDIWYLDALFIRIGVTGREVA